MKIQDEIKIKIKIVQNPTHTSSEICGAKEKWNAQKRRSKLIAEFMLRMTNLHILLDGERMFLTAH